MAIHKSEIKFGLHKSENKFGLRKSENEFGLRKSEKFSCVFFQKVSMENIKLILINKQMS